jgi:hypothetical protein
MALTIDKATLEAALVGYQHQLERIEAKMAELRQTLNHTPGTAPIAAPVVTTRGRKTGRHRMSEEGRARIAAAQRARWAKLKKSQS